MSRCTMPPLVRGRQPTRHLRRRVQGLAHGHRPAIQRGAQRLPFEELGDEERAVIAAPDVVERQDVGMVERCRGPRLLLEALEPIGIGDRSGGQQLQRDVAPQPRVARAIDLAHPARTQRPGHDIRAHLTAG